ncbi:hypothetical protein LguiB_013678 [Lonicera macranthoides]
MSVPTFHNCYNPTQPLSSVNIQLIAANVAVRAGADVNVVTTGIDNFNPKADSDHLTFPGGGTQFKNGALHYIDFIQKSLLDIAWGKRSRVILDVGCGVASFGGYIFERNVLVMSLAPKDEHEAQVQFALDDLS